MHTEKRTNNSGDGKGTLIYELLATPPSNQVNPRENPSLQ
jgi:hypothetical protein